MFVKEEGEDGVYSSTKRCEFILKAMGKVIDYINSLSIRDEYYRIFGKRIPEGKMYCCFHNNTNTPSAKCYGNHIHCFSCNKNYGTYDLLKKYDPQRIDDLKSSAVMETEQESPHDRIKIKSIDRSKPIDRVLAFLLS